MTIGYIDIGANSARILIPLYEEDELSDTIVYKRNVTGRGKEGFLNGESLKSEFKQIAEELRSELDTSNLPPCCVAVKDNEAITDMCSLSVRTEGKAIAKSDVLYLKRNIDLDCPDDYVPLHRIPIGFRFDGGELIQDPVGQRGEVLSFYVMLIAVRRSELQSYAYFLQAAGVKIQHFIYDGLAHGLAAVRETNETTCTVFDLGANTTGVSIFENGLPVHFGYTPNGMDLLGIELVRQLRCSGDAADKLIMSKGMAARGNAITYLYSDNKTKGSVDVPRFVNILRLKLSIILQAARGEMANSLWPEITPSYRHKIVLTGGGRSLGDLLRVSQQLLKVSTTIARGWDRSDGDNAFMACLGMWMYMDGDNFGEPEFAKVARIGDKSAGGIWQWLKSVFS